MAVRTKRRSKTPAKAKSPRIPRARAKAISGKDPVKKSEPRQPATSLLDAHLAFMKAAWAFNPMQLMMQQQAAMWRGMNAGTPGSQSPKRAKRKPARSARQARA